MLIRTPAERMNCKPHICRVIMTEACHAMQDDRKAKLEQMEELQESLSRAQKEMAQYADSDPTKVEAMGELQSLSRQPQEHFALHACFRGKV